jgi:hypothetical protein
MLTRHDESVGSVKVRIPVAAIAGAIREGLGDARRQGFSFRGDGAGSGGEDGGDSDPE